MPQLRKKAKARSQGSSSTNPRRKKYLFVYGTLKRGGRFHHRLTRDHNVRLVGSARIRGELYKLPGASFPGAVPSNQRNQFVYGQLFVLQDPDNALPQLDEFEGIDEGLFRRKLVDVWMDGKKTKAWTYFYARPLKDATLLTAGTFPTS